MKRGYRHDRERGLRASAIRTRPPQTLSPSPSSRRPREIGPNTDPTGVIRYMQSNAMSRRNVPSMPKMPWEDQ